nr:glycosyltransferase [Pedobacter aquatilis]
MSVSKLCEATGLSSLNSPQSGPDRENEFSVKVFTTTANGKSELQIKTGKTYLLENVQVTYFNRWTKDHSHFSPGLLWNLSKAIRQTKHNNLPLIIHIHAWWNLVSILSCLVAKLHKIHIILSPRGMLTAYTQSNRNLFFKKLIHQVIGKNLLRFVHIHATSEQEKLEVLKIVQPKSVTVIPNLVSFAQANVGEDQLITDKFQSAGAVFNLIFLSRIEEKKGLEILFDALSTLRIDFRLTIAGAGNAHYLKTLKAKAQELKLSGRLDWIGHVSDQNKFELIARHDLLVLSSYNENFANVVVESLSIGTPVLISEHVGMTAYVKDKEFGWICKLTPDDIKAQIDSAFQDQPKRNRIRNLAPEIIKRDFNDEVLARRYVELYQKILTNKTNANIKIG